VIVIWTELLSPILEVLVCRSPFGVRNPPVEWRRIDGKQSFGGELTESRVWRREDG
jgi:hypothetical protein